MFVEAFMSVIELFSITTPDSVPDPVESPTKTPLAELDGESTSVRLPTFVIVLLVTCAEDVV
ncbi:MAG: hypothetical protein U5L75_02865 [Candidatus Campbellbacteria bacterium]|nr:hypothetical protein [Candidatus Campbellbacteria bacterium]